MTSNSMVMLLYSLNRQWTWNYQCAAITTWHGFNIPGSVHRESMSIIVQQDATMYSLLYFCRLLCMFRVVTSPIIKSTYNCNYSIWQWSNFGKCGVWNQLKMRVMDSTVSANFRDRGTDICKNFVPLCDILRCIQFVFSSYFFKSRKM